jgi:hypothetical protein
MRKDSLKHGYFFTVYETGERMKQGHYIDGKNRGWSFFWWRNGRLNQEWYINDSPFQLVFPSRIPMITLFGYGLRNKDGLCGLYRGNTDRCFGRAP